MRAGGGLGNGTQILADDDRRVARGRLGQRSQLPFVTAHGEPLHDGVPPRLVSVDRDSEHQRAGRGAAQQVQDATSRFGGVAGHHTQQAADPSPIPHSGLRPMAVTSA